MQGSHTSLEFKASLEKSLNFGKLKLFWKEWKALKSLELSIMKHTSNLCV